MKVMVSHPTGNRNVRAVLTSFSAAGLLAGFNTTLAVDPKHYLLNLLPERFSRELMRRSYPIHYDLIYTRPLLELGRNLFPKRVSVDIVYEDMDKAFAANLSKINVKKSLNAVYAYEDGALHTFTRAKKLGLTCIYDLPIAYWETAQRLMREEALRLPDWSVTLGGGMTDTAGKLHRKTQELELADVVVVPGSFVKNSLPDWALKKKIIVAPFGSPNGIASIPEQSEKNMERPLKVLFVGSLGQRKGLGDLFEAIKLLDPTQVELILMGVPMAPLEFYRYEYEHFRYEKVRPHEQVLELMRSCDVFCLPSIVEGRALVLQEAMSQGLPVILTENTGGADLVIEGETGFIVPIRNPEQIAEKLTWCIENRDILQKMGIKAQQHAATYTWESYGNQIISGCIDEV